MAIGARLRQLREEKNLSQGDITESTGLARSYISRVEHEHTVPSIETLHRFAAALGVPLYKIFYKSEDSLIRPQRPSERSLERLASESGAAAEEARFLLKMREFSAKMDDSERSLLLQFARKLAHNRSRHREPRDASSATHAAAGRVS
jgi:transcriptional regulator with XRE-family HTH domain